MTATPQSAAPPPLCFSLLPVDQVGNLGELWRELQSRSDCSFFTTWDWMSQWLNDTVAACYVLVGRSGDRVVALALFHPASDRRHTFLKTRALMLHQSGDPTRDVITIEYNGFLVDRTMAEAAILGALGFLERSDISSVIGHDWNEMHFGGVPAGFEPVARRTDLLVWQRSRKPSWRVDLDAIRNSGSSYLDHLSANTRYQIRRAMRLYEKRGPLAAARARDVDEAMRFYAEMQELHQRYWSNRGEPGSYAYPFYERFHRTLITECIPRGTIELMRVTAGESVIGYVYNFVYRGWVCAYHTGLSYDNDAKLKPGLVSHYLCIEQHLREGAHLYDFLAGDNRYKANLGTPGPDMLNLVLQRPIAMLRAESALRSVKTAWVSRINAAVSDDIERPPPKPARAGKVLVFGDDTRSFLTVVRSLGRQGVVVHVAPINFSSPALRSRYVARVHRLPAYVGGGAEWVDSLKALLATERYDLVIPCDDRALLPCHVHRDALSQLTRLAIPSPTAVEILFNKEKTKKLAASLGVNLARTIVPRHGDTPAEIIDKLGTPVVVKPTNSYDIFTLHRRAIVRVVDTPDELSHAISDLAPDEFYYEEFFEGRGVGLSVLADRGKILLAFQHHRVHEPPRGGAAPYRVSAAPSPELVEACSKIAEQLDFTGVAMFEFRRNFETGAWILLEVNARPWGSLPLPVALGVDFPYAWYLLLLEAKRPTQPAYRYGVYGRNPILDFNYITDAASRSDSVGGKTRVLAGWIGGFWHLIVGRERLDTLVADDLRPGLIELGEFLRFLAGRIAKRVPFGVTMQRFSARSKLRLALRSARREARPVSIVFVCFGNICRSPFAELLLKRLAAGGSHRIATSSAGTYPIGGRSSPGEAVSAARRFDVGLDGHASRHATDTLIEGATVVLAFDEANVEALQSRFPDLACPIILLGLLADDGGAPREISDPYGQGEEEFVTIYGLIRNAVSAVYRRIQDADGR